MFIRIFVSVFFLEIAVEGKERTQIFKINKVKMSEEQKSDNRNLIDEASDNHNNDDEKYCSCFKQNYCIPKVFYFFYFAGLGAMVPYLPLFYKQLGLPAKEAGIISGTQPFISFLFTPVWGAFADRFKKGKLVFSISFMAMAAVGISFLLTPMQPCEDDLDGESRREMTITPNRSFVAKISQIIAESQQLDRWPMEIEDQINLHTLQSKQHSYEGEFNVFLYLLLVNLFGTLFSCPGLALGDAAAVCLLRRNNDVHKYGKQKRWASIGWGVAAFTFGAIISDQYLCPYVPGQKRKINYSLCFYGAITLKLLALFSGLRLDFDMNGNKDGSRGNEKESGVKAAIKAVCRPSYVAFFMVVLYSGMTFGMILGFLFWHLEDFSAPQIIFSIIPVVRSIADVVVYTVSPHLITKIGVLNLIYLVLVGYVTRLACYVFITNTWCFLFLEVLSGLTSAGGWAGFVAFIAYNSVEGAPATLQGNIIISRIPPISACPCNMAKANSGEFHMNREGGEQQRIPILGLISCNYKGIEH